MHVRLGTTGGGWEHNPDADGNFDHIMMVRMAANGPVISNLRLDGILNHKGKLPGNGDELCFSERTCARQ